MKLSTCGIEDFWTFPVGKKRSTTTAIQYIRMATYSPVGFGFKKLCHADPLQKPEIAIFFSRRPISALCMGAPNFRPEELGSIDAWFDINSLSLAHGFRKTHMICSHGNQKLWVSRFMAQLNQKTNRLVAKQLLFIWVFIQIWRANTWDVHPPWVRVRGEHLT